MTVQHQLEVYIENLCQFLCQLSKKVVHVIVSNLLCTATDSIRKKIAVLVQQTCLYT